MARFFHHHVEVLLAHFERPKGICVSSLVLFVALLVVEAAIVVHGNNLALFLSVERATQGLKLLEGIHFLLCLLTCFRYDRRLRLLRDRLKVHLWSLQASFVFLIDPSNDRNLRHGSHLWVIVCYDMLRI